MNIRKAYNNSLELERIDRKSYIETILLESDIAILPEILKKYMKNCGYLNKSKIINGKILWDNVFHRSNHKGNFRELKYHQFNSVVKVSRLVYIDVKFLELIEKYQDGVGSWLMVLLKFIKMINIKNKREINETALVTLLSDFLIFPTLFLLPNVKFESIASNELRVEFTHNDSTVSGIFYFSENGEISKFETNNRYYSENGKDFKKVKWIGRSENYIERNGIRTPSVYTALWEIENEKYEYFKGEIREIIYNI